MPEGDGPFPVVVTVHGGPESQWQPWYSSGFGAFTQFLVSRGYAVAAPNVRGSTGYGKRFEHLDDVEKRLDSVADLASLHEWLAARPEIDGVACGRLRALLRRVHGPGRARVPAGALGGGDRVRRHLQPPHLPREHVGIPACRARARVRVARRDRELLERLSPWSRLDAIKAPLFIEHGRNDPRVPVGESEAIHAVLVEKGVRCELVIYEDEGHTVEKLANRIDSFERAVRFLDEVLGPVELAPIR